MTRPHPRSVPAAGRRRPSRWRALALALLGMAAAMPVGAASLQVAPISVELAPGAQAEALWLSNTGDQPIQAQVRVMAWSQDAEGDRLEPSRELMPSPPIVAIAPGERQLVRIVRPQAGAVPAERAFRLLVDELPDPRQPASSGLQFLLQYSVPVFVLPPGATPADTPGPRPPTDASALSASVEGRGEHARLVVVNRGARRVRLSELARVDASGAETPLVAGLVGYVLAGQRMHWPLPLATDGLRGSSLRVRLNDDRDAQILPLSPPPP